MILATYFLPRILHIFICSIILTLTFYVQTNASDDVMTDKAMIDLAYSDDRYRNVGALYEVYQFPCCAPWRQKIASVVYIGGKSCLTNAHCFESSFWDLGHNFLTGYQISFELVGGDHTFFDVLDYVVHPDYQVSDYNDIAMVCLDKIVGLSGLATVYSFGKDKYYIVDPAHSQLTCIGYGHSGDDDSNFVNNDSFKRAFQTRLFYVQKPDSLKEIIRLSMPNKSICTLPYKCDVKLVTKEEYVTVPRSRFPNESLMRQGMSGGAMLYNGDFVGVNAIMLYGSTSFYDHTVQRILSYTNTCLNGVIWPFGQLRVSFPFKGSATYSVPLGMYADWIEEHRARFDGALPLQPQAISLGDRMADLEQGSWVEASYAEKDKTD